MPSKLTYDIGTGMFVTRDTSVRVTQERIIWEQKRKHAELSAPPKGYGIDGRPLMRGKARK